MKKYFEGKRIVAALLAVVVTLTSLPLNVFAGTSELLTNGTFKDGSLEGWTTQGEVSTSSDGWISGTYAMLSGGTELAVLQSDSVVVEAEQNYVISASVRDYEGSIFKAQIQQYNISGESAAGPIEIPVSVTKGEWDEFSYIFQTAADVTQIAVCFENGAGYVDVDNVSVKPTSKYPVYNPNGTSVEIENANFSKKLTGWEVDGAATTTSGFTGHAVELTPGNTVYQVGIKLESASLYELHYYVKATNAADCKSAIRLQYLDMNNQVQTLTPFELSGNSVAEGWQEVTTQFETEDVGDTATLLLNVEGNASATVAFDEIQLTQLESGANVAPFSLSPQAETENLFTNGSFILDTEKVAYGTTDFDLKTGFADGLFAWGNANQAKDRYTWVVEQGGAGTHGNAFEITGKGIDTATSLLHMINWEAGKTYTISYWLKTGSAGTPVLNLFLGGDLQRTVVNGGSGQISGVVSDWTQYVFEYTATEKAATEKKNLTFSISLADSTESIYLADVQVAEKQQSQQPEESETENLFTNGSFILDTEKVAYGTADFDLKTGFADGLFAWGNANQAKERYTWVVEQGGAGTHGNAFKITGKGNDAATSLLHTINWEAGKTYTISYWLKTGSTGTPVLNLFLGGDLQRTVVSGGSGQISGVVSDWTQYVFEYTATETAATTRKNLTFSISLADSTESIYLADVQVAEKQQSQQPEESGTENLFTNGSFILDTEKVAYGTADFDLKTGFADGLFAWGNTNWAKDRYTWVVEQGGAGTHGNAFKITGKGNDAATSLLHTINWEAGKTYTISYWLKTGSAGTPVLNLFLGGDLQRTVVSGGSGQISGVVSDWTQYVFEYTATETAATTRKNLTFSISLADSTESIYLADVKVVEKQQSQEPEVPVVPKRLDNGNFTEGAKSWIGITDPNIADGTANGAESGNVMKVTAANTTVVKHDVFTEPLEVGKQYTLSFRARNNALTGADIASVYFTKKDGTGKIAETVLSASNGIWKEYIFDFTATADYVEPQLCLDLQNATGVEFVFADFSFTEYAPILANGDFNEVGEVKDNKLQIPGWSVNIRDDNKELKSQYYDVVDLGGEHGNVVKIVKEKSTNSQHYADLTSNALTGDKALTIGEKYHISFDIMTQPDNATASYSFLIRKDSGTTTAYIGGGTDGEWQTVSYEYIPAEGDDNLMIAVRANATSGGSSSTIEYYVDNVRIERTGETVKGDSAIMNGKYKLLNGTYPEFWGLLGTDSDDVKAYASGGDAKITEFYSGVTETKFTASGTGLSKAESDWKQYTYEYKATQANGKLAFMYNLRSKNETVYLADVKVYDKADTEKKNILTNGGFTLADGIEETNFAMPSGFKDGGWYWPNPNAKNMTWSVATDSEHGDVFKVNGSETAQGYWLWQDLNWEAGKTYVVSYWMKTGSTAELSQEAEGYIEAKNQSGSEVGASTLIPVYEGADYTLKFWLKANQAARRCFEVRVTNYKDDTRTVIDGTASDRPTLNLANTDDWQLVEVACTAVKGTAYADLSFIATAEGSEFSISGAEIVLGEEARYNTSFEIGDVGGKPLAWTFSGSAVFTKEVGGVDGEYAGKLVNGSTGHLLGPDFEVEPNTYYEFSYWTKRESPYDSMMYPLFSQKQADGSASATASITFPAAIRVYGSTDGEWKQVRYFFKTAEDAGLVNFRLVISGVFDEIWVDDAKIVQKDPIPNLDFESVDEDGNPESWYLGDALNEKPVIRQDTEYYHSGTSSVYLKVDTQVGSQTLTSSYLFPVTATGDVRIFEHSFWVASRNSNTKSVRLDLKYYEDYGVPLANDATRQGIYQTLNGGPEICEWQQMIVRSDIPAEAKYVQLVFTFTQGSAELWIDDVFFDRVESDTEIVVAHNDFHAVDQDGNMAEWTADGGTLVQKTENNIPYGSLSGGTMSYTTNKLATEYYYKYTLKYRSDKEVNATVRFYDYKRNEYTDRTVTQTLPATDGYWKEVDIEFVAPSCTTSDLELGNGGQLDVAYIILYQTAKPSTKPTWTAKWIAYRSDYRWSNEYDSSYYRKKITLEDEVVKAPFQITGDDKFALWVNGVEIYNNIEDPTGTWAAIQVFDLVDYLKKGDNIIAVEVYNLGAYSATIFDGIWTYANGGQVECISDGDTLCHDEKPVGDWKAYNYDDSDWNRSRIAGPVPTSPWGDIYFESSLYIDNLIELEPVEGEGVLVNDLEYEFSVKMKLKKAIDAQLPFNAVLWRRNSITSICTTPITLLDHQNMTEWPVDEWFTVKMKVELPDYIDDGNYTLQLANDYFIIENEEIYDNKFISFKVVNDYIATERVSKVETINGVPTLTIDGAPASQFWWKYGNNSTSALSTIGESDYEIYITQGIKTGEGESGNGLWNESGAFEYETMDKAINTALAASSKANIIVQLKLYSPSWWMEENPGEVATTIDGNGNVRKHLSASFGSEKWKLQAGELIKDIIAYMRQQKYYSRIVGIRLIAGGTDEFITFADNGELPDYSDAAIRYFKNWAKETYGTIENLREAWNEPDLASFDDIEPPTRDEMYTDGGTGVMYNPKTQQKCIDWSNLLGVMTTDTMNYWAKIAKEATDNKLVVGAYYGYLFSGFGETTAPTTFDEVLNSPYIDFFCGPQSYNERQLGESGTVQGVADTVRAYGKMYVNEQDNRTVLSGQFAGSVWDTSRAYSVGHTFTMEDTILQEKRDAVYNIVNGNASYCYDMQGGWMNDQQLFDLVRDINNEYYHAAYTERDLMNDIALIIPDQNPAYFRYDSGKDSSNNVMLNQTVLSLGMFNVHRKQLAQSGAGYDIYALSTLEDGKLPQHKINIFFTPLYLSEEQRDLIDQYCKNSGQINIFLFMSGYGAEDGCDVENMTELTGFEFELDMDSKSSGNIRVVDSGHQLTEGLAGDVFGTQAAIGSKYYVDEISVKESSDQVVLGRLVDSGKIGMALKDMGDWTSIYCMTPQLSAELYRNLLEFAGSHIYSDNRSDIVWSNSAYVGVHSVAGGQKTINLPGNYAVYDVFEETYISMDTNVIEYENKVNDTHLFRLTPSNTYSLLAYVKGGNGTISENGLFYLSKGESKTFTITPNEGYMIKTVTINGEEVEVGADNTITVSNIESNQTIVVNFKRVPTNRTLDEGNEGEETQNNNNESGSNTTVPKAEESVDGTGNVVEVVKDAYQEIWATVRDIISIPWWLLLIWGIGIGGVIFLIRFLIIKWKEKRNEK